jgi:hypothetical protein
MGFFSGRSKKKGNRLFLKKTTRLTANAGCGSPVFSALVFRKQYFDLFWASLGAGACLTNNPEGVACL